MSVIIKLMKTVLITGGTRGIGLAIAEKYLNDGESNVIVTGRKPDTLEELQNSINNENFHAMMAKADDEEAADQTCKEINEKFGSLDILINNAGTNPAGGNLMDVDMGALEKTWAVNQKGPLLWARAAYKISKAALINMTKQLAYELAPDIRVNGVAPAIVRTRLSQLLWENEEYSKNLHLLQKLGEPEDIAEAVYFLCSEEAGWITGEILTIDGGFSINGNSLS